MSLGGRGQQAERVASSRKRGVESTRLLFPQEKYCKPSFFVVTELEIIRVLFTRSSALFSFIRVRARLNNVIQMPGNSNAVLHII